MEVINLSKKKVIPILLNDVECVAVLDNTSIDHFQRANKVGFLQGLEAMQTNEIAGIKKLIGSVVREKKTNRILGAKYFNQFNDLEIIAYMTPILEQLLPNLPQPNGKTEKK